MRTITIIPKNLKPNLKLANRFLDALCNDSLVTFQTFCDAKGGDGIGRLMKKFQGRSVDNYSELEALQQKGAGVFFMANEGDGKGRKAENVIRVRALFVDLDGSPLQPVLDAELAPHIIVETSPDRYHGYWLVSGCPLDEFKRMQKKLAIKFNGDRSVNDLCRVMRLPGFYHLKNPSKPFMTRIHSISDDLTPYRLAEIVEQLFQTNSDEASDDDPTSETDEAEFVWVEESTGEIRDLVEWAKYYPAFDLLKALRKRKPEVLVGKTTKGKQHIRCPNESAHTEKGEDSSTFAMSPNESSTKGFVIKCMHKHCCDLDRLEMIIMMLDRGWLKWSDLEHPSFNVIKDDGIHPEWIKQSTDEVVGHLQILATPIEKLRVVYLGIISIQRCHKGYLPNNDTVIARLLGATLSEWQQNKATFSELGLIQVDEKGIQVPIYLKE